MKALRRKARGTALGLALAGIVAVLVGSGLVPASATATTKQIAVSTLDGDLKVTLTATQGSEAGGAPPATVKVAAYQRESGDWRLIGQQTVGDPNSWFWNVVTGPGATCRFSTSDVDPYPIEVRLLVSESIGCSAATYNYHVDKYGALVPG